MEAHSHAVLGDSLLEAGRSADAEEAFRRSLALRPALGDRRGEGWMLERLGRALRGQGRTSDAVATLEQAANVAREIGDAGLAKAVEPSLMSQRSDSNLQRT
jgi:tetratricopeptide (TPR) repeat protein